MIACREKVHGALFIHAFSFAGLVFRQDPQTFFRDSKSKEVMEHD